MARTRGEAKKNPRLSAERSTVVIPLQHLVVERSCGKLGKSESIKDKMERVRKKFGELSQIEQTNVFINKIVKQVYCSNLYLGANYSQ